MTKKKVKYVRARKKLVGKLLKAIVVSDDLVRRGLRMKRKKKGYWYLRKGTLYINPKKYEK